SYLDCPAYAGVPYGPSSTHQAGSSTTLKFSPSATFRGVTVQFTFTATFTSSTSDTTGVTLNYANGPNLTLRYFPATGSCANPIYGDELHVWDMSSPPDYTVSASPHSFNEQQGSGWSASSSIGVQAIWGWSLPVSITAGSDDTSLTLIPNPSSVNPNGASASSTLTITDPKASDCGTYSISVSAQSGSLWRSLTLPLYIAPIDFCVFVNPNFDIGGAPPAGGCQTISIISTNRGTITFSGTGQSPLQQPTFNPASVPVTAGTKT